jgi:nicotinate-nucleotide--dimethylbenzimidazole phosphoribosyltransferase
MRTIDLVPLREAVGLRDLEAAADARLLRTTLATPPGSMGRLDQLAAWLAGAQGQCPPRPVTDVRVVVLAGDHGVARPGPTRPGDLPDTPSTGDLLRALVAGRTGTSALARLNGARVRALDVAVDGDTSDLPAIVTEHKIRCGSGSIDRQDALTDAEVEASFRLGMTIADQEVDAGADLLVLASLGDGARTVAAALVGALLGLSALDLVDGSADVDDATWAGTVGALRDALYRARRHREDPLAVLRTVGSADTAASTGFLVQAAVRRTPVLLDGVVSCACALVGRRLVEGANQWWLASHRSTEPAQRRVLDLLGLEPLVDLGLRLDDGTGALTALPVLRAAQTMLADAPLLTDLRPTDLRSTDLRSTDLRSTTST